MTGGIRSLEAKNMANTQESAAGIDFRLVCDHLYDGIHITDGEGRILYINQAYTRTTGIQPEELVGRRVSEVEGELYTGSVTDRVIRQRQRVNAVAHILRLDKEVLVTGTPVFDRGGRLALVVTNTRDFPELKRLESRLSALTLQQERTNRELAYLRNRQFEGQEMIYRSPAMEDVMRLVNTVAPTDATVLITGESGTGKELVANELYQRSNRSGKPFIKLNCAAIPAELLESELFGYEDGAFTGARRAGKAGIFELANQGVILLDEIGDMPMPLQSKLLRVLQSRTLRRIGGSTSIHLDIRLLAATNKDLPAEVRAGRFREDLYYRLNVVPIPLPPLRERKEDIPLLAGFFCRQFGRKYGRNVRFSQDALSLLTEYDWPGNIRELENLVERLVITCPSGSLSRHSVAAALSSGGHIPSPEVHVSDGSLKSQLRVYERAIISQSIQRAGSIRKAAQLLQVDHSTLVKKCRLYGLHNDRQEQ